MTIGCLLIFPAICLLPIFLSVDRIPSLNVCLGHMELDFLGTYYIALFSNFFITCNVLISGKSGFRYDSLWSKIVAYSILAVLMPICLNILDLYFLKQVYNQCERQADVVKSLLSEEAYKARKRYSIPIHFSHILIQLNVHQMKF